MPPLHIQAQTPPRVAFRTVGCKLNQCETAQMQQSFLTHGYELVDWGQQADVRVINTCTVTAKSDRTCRREIRSAKRLDPDCIVVVTGCYAQIDPESMSAIPGVDLVLGNADKQDIIQHLVAAQRLRRGAPQQPSEARVATPLVVHQTAAHTPTAESTEFITHFYGYTRAFLKVQTGCDSRCAYCIIPLARGPARSMPADQVVEQIRVLVARDYKEVVLTGINLGSWGTDSGEGRPTDLVRRLLGETGVERLRLSSVEPLQVDDGLLDAVAEAGDRVAHHFHLPLQSGTDAVLRRMRRPYTADEYLRVAREIARRFPCAAIGADVIVGFPGETDEHFAETCRFVEASPLTYLHVFSYSDRPGTAASTMADKIHPDVIHERSRRLRHVGESLSARFTERVTGTEQRALILREPAQHDHLVAITGNYVEAAVLDGDDGLVNSFVRGVLSRDPHNGGWLLTDPVPEAQS